MSRPRASPITLLENRPSGQRVEECCARSKETVRRISFNSFECHAVHASISVSRPVVHSTYNNHYLHVCLLVTLATLSCIFMNVRGGLNQGFGFRRQNVAIGWRVLCWIVFLSAAGRGVTHS